MDGENKGSNPMNKWDVSLGVFHPYFWFNTYLMRKSYFDADGIEKRELPGDLSDSARRAIEATEVEEVSRGTGMEGR